MIALSRETTIGVLLSGGLDSSILLARLLEQGHQVQPFYIRSDLIWQQDEINGLQRFLRSFSMPTLKPVICLDLPLSDLYRDHWSITGRNTPGADTVDDAVYLPGRNVLLVVKAAMWCQLHGIEQLAIATLGTSPFADATSGFFDMLQTTLNWGGPRDVHVLRPFGEMNKQQVMQLGHGYPLELTFSCISPVVGVHCGQCNKCGERQRAFRSVGRNDKTQYVSPILFQ